MISNILKMYHEENRYDVIFSTEDLVGKKEHVKNVLKIISSMPINLDIDIELLTICAEHHDDGRVDQYELLGKFNDRVVTHNVLGVDRFDKFLLQNGNVSIDDSITIMRDVMLYHGRVNLLSNPISRQYVELVTVADDFENATSAVSYLLKEVETDAKGYRASNPTADQKRVSDFVFSKFANGEKFDKMKYCTTYGEYVIFAATLATSCIKKYESFARSTMLQPGYGYSSILEGYKDIFSKTLDANVSQKAYDILLSML